MRTDPPPAAVDAAAVEALPHGRHRASKLPHRVASAIVEQIVDGDLDAGARLPSEPELAARFGVSRVSVREGLRVLETFGVVRIKQGKNGGNEVGAVDAEALAGALALFFRVARATYGDLMDARVAIEPFMAARAAERQAPAQLDALRALLEREATSPSGTREADELALGFHWLVCGSSGNPVMDGIGRAIHILYGDHVGDGQLYTPACWTSARGIHQEIGDAVLAGDARRAQALMTAHMEDFRALQQERLPALLDAVVAWAP